MAFRKLPRGVYRSPLSNSVSFGEVEFSDVFDEDGKTILLKKRVMSEELSKRTLDCSLFTPTNVIRSGRLIQGSTSMTPSDPDNIERPVERGLLSYISNNPTLPSNNE